MYGTMEKDGNKETMPLVETNDSIINLYQSDEQFLKNPFGDDKGNKAFWKKVSDAYGDGSNISWDVALNDVRADEFIERVTVDKKDPLVFLIEVIHDEFVKKVDDPRLCTGFIMQLTKLGCTILKKDAESGKKDPSYSKVLQDHPKKVTILHLLAERNLVDFAEVYVSKEYYPGHVHVDSQLQPKKLPLDFALENRHDAVASLLIKKMRRSRVRMLFQYDEATNAKFKFADIINDPNMQETVIGILQACVNPDWPFVPTEKGENVEMAWSKLQDKPIQYHFNYRLLDGDQGSEPAKIDGVFNEEFKHLEPSCLQLLIDSPHSDVTISHPAIRVLVDRKWDLYGKYKIWQWFALYMFFVVCLGFALFLDDTETPREYSTSKGKARGVFEVLVLLFTIGYFIEEIDQLMKEKANYFSDKYNAFDVVGVLLIIVMVPLRFTDNVRAECGVGAVAFLVNCLRVFKYFPAYRDLGVYSKTFAEIIRVDIVKFAKLFIVVMFGFTGCMFLALKAATFPKHDLSFWTILLKEVRALAEGNPFEDSYDTFHVVIIILIVLNMGTIIVVLSNILIGQLSSRYTIAQEEAKIRFSIDKAKYITKVEKSRFMCMNLRMKHYVDGDYIADEAYITELLTDWEKLTEKRTHESKFAIRKLYDRQ